ncbi:MAG TPA: DNA primase [Pseudomonadales bacterium]|nr:DNA primase [Pseudomonadales bacterium]
MAGLIPQSFIDDLLDRTDIVEVIDRRVRLKKSGRNYMACCPFHEEKSPSFSVSQEKQFYHCFGCGASGNAIGFLMAYENMDFPRAVESLAQLQGVEVPREALSEHEQKSQRVQQDLCALLEQAAHFFRQQLQRHPDAKKARDYLQKRGLSEAIIEQYGIGYAPPGWDNLMQHLLKAGWQEAQLLDSGMLVDREESGKRYDRFRDRVMFPIRDLRGRVIAFGGRVLTDEKPKYLNSPETPVFSKGRELYGLYEANRSKGALQRLVVVEGYMDVVALAQFGLVGAVATLGTAAGTAHLDKAFRYSNEIVFCFDGDAAGRRAAVRALEVSLTTLRDQRQVRFLFLSEGEDPDSYVRKRGLDTFTALLEKAQPLSEYLFEQAGLGLRMDTAEGRAGLVSRSLPMLAKLPEGPFRQQMFIDLSMRTQMDTMALTQMAGSVDVRTPFSVSETPVHDLELGSRKFSGRDLDDYEPSGHEPESYEPVNLESASREHARYSPAAQAKKRVELNLPESALHLLLHYPHLHVHVVHELPRLRQGKQPNELVWLVQLAELLQEHPQASRSRILGLWHGRFGDGGSSARLYELADRENLIASELLAAPQLRDILDRLLALIEQESPLESLIAKSRQGALTELEKHELTRLLKEKHSSR